MTNHPKTKHRHDQCILPGQIFSARPKETKNMDMTKTCEGGFECVKIESLRLGFTLSKPSLIDSIFTWRTRRNRVS